ncbi:MAG TPA: PD-(D/E)XK nuclease family protein [Holophagaceae bacterium]|nr:PD-(D/E)XK nuclease family protein [Holophagaceae bacterium]
MSFAPFDGVLLDDPREPVPGALAVLLHLQVERRLAKAAGRAELAREAVMDRAAACRLLLERGLLPAQLRSLGLPLGEPRHARSLESLARHLETYLGAVAQRGFMEPSVALWEAAARQERGERGFWVERGPEDGPLPAELPDLEPPRLRALLALPELGSVSFRLATSRGAGRHGLFGTPEPHLVRDLLPRLEQLCAERGVAHFELEPPPGWGESPWGGALDGLFEGPLDLDEEGRRRLTRALLPTGAAVLRAAVEQVRAWVDEGFAPADITLLHPDPAAWGPLLKALLAAEGIAFGGLPGGPLLQSAEWAPLWGLLEGLRDRDAVRVGAGLAAAPGGSRLGQALGRLGDRLALSDQTGEAPLAEILALLPEGDRAWARERWDFLLSLPAKRQPLGAWALDLRSAVQRLELVRDLHRFYPAWGLLQEAWSGEAGAVSFEEALEALQGFLETGTTESEPGVREGVRLAAPAQVLRDWPGSRATLVLDLGEGAWPATPRPLPDLDWERMAAINAALRKLDAPFPPALQAFWMPRSEAGERIPRAFQREAYAFNRALALTSERFVALSSERDGDGQKRAQGPFWQALEGAGEWGPDPARAASHLRHRWEAAAPDALTRARQAAVRLQDPAALPALAAEPPESDLAPGWWKEGLDEANPISPTRLEALARCPFQVLARRGLGLQEQDDEEQVMLRLGELAHGVMEGLLAGLESAEHWPDAFREKHHLESLDPAGLEPLVRAAAESVVLGGEALSGAAQRRLHLLLEDLVPDLAACLAWDLALKGPVKGEPELAGPWTRRLLGTEAELPALPLETPEGPVWVRGKVDRLERITAPGGSFLRVVDYKTSRESKLKTYAKDSGFLGPRLQLPLYQWMLETRHGGPVAAHLVALRGFASLGRGFVPAMLATPEERQSLATNVGRLVARAREGRFPAVPGEHCAHCTLSALCGRPVDLDAVDANGEGA